MASNIQTVCSLPLIRIFRYVSRDFRLYSELFSLRHNSISRDEGVIASGGHSNDPIMAAPTRYGFSAGRAKPYLKDEFTAIVTPDCLSD